MKVVMLTRLMSKIVIFIVYAHQKKYIIYASWKSKFWKTANLLLNLQIILRQFGIRVVEYTHFFPQRFYFPQPITAIHGKIKNPMNYIMLSIYGCDICLL
ncbi:hypothetical protein AAU61_01080 [Desulfocarbo indianensis]|nr:hypothetical protein AAU61_01080 [Desulfocarbo indianensis]